MYACFATPRHAWQRSRHALQRPLALQLIRQQVGGFLFDVGLLGPCKSMPRSAKDVASMPRTLQSMPRTAEDVAKQAYTS